MKQSLLNFKTTRVKREASELKDPNSKVGSKRRIVDSNDNDYFLGSTDSNESEDDDTDLEEQNVSKKSLSLRNLSTAPAKSIIKKVPSFRLKTVSNVASNISSLSSSTLVDSNSEPWIVKYQPRSVHEVALHSARKQQVNNLLESRPRIGVLSGPAGCSKTAIVLTTAKELGIHHIVEWKNPDREEGMSTARMFEDFLQGVKYSGVSASKTLAVVEDLPYVGSYEAKSQFARCIQEYLLNDYDTLNTPMLILIITEVDTEEGERFSVENLLPPAILDHPSLQRIKFQPVAPTIIIKALKAICTKAPELKNISAKRISTITKSLAVSGDIRSAIWGLEFFSLYPSSDNILSIGRDTDLGFFHAIGRILYGSKDPRLNTNRLQIDCIINTWGASELIMDGIFENYHGAKSSRLGLDSAALITNYLSEADLASRAAGITGNSRNISGDTNHDSLMTELAYYGSRIAIDHSVADANCVPVHRQMTFASRRDLRNNTESTKRRLDRYLRQTFVEKGYQMSKLDLQLESFYENIVYDGDTSPAELAAVLDDILSLASDSEDSVGWLNAS